MSKIVVIGFFLLALLGSCQEKKPVLVEPVEDRQAKESFQGIWINEDDESIAFRAKGDTLYYPDSTIQPMHFSIVGDTLVLKGEYVNKYKIIKLLPHLFHFKNQSGDVVRLVKSEDASDSQAFNESPQSVTLNQQKLIKRDTVIIWQGERYHCYVQVNPTTYKVFKQTYNAEVVEVENAYFDNIINLAVFHGASKVMSADFHKQDFSRLVPVDYLKQSILNDMIFSGIDASGIHYDALINIPDSPSGYVVAVNIDFSGKLTMKVR